MAEVYTVRLAIPGQGIDEYFAALGKAERERAPFKQYLTKLNEEFGDYIAAEYSEKTAHRHAGTVAMFISFLCWYTDVKTVQEITRGVANSHFRKWYKRKVWDSATEDDLKAGLRKFFMFMASKGIEFDSKILVGLK